MLSRVLDPCTMVRIQTWDSQAVAPAKVEEVLGIAWPQEIGALACGRADVICTGPTDWLMIAADPEAAAFLHELSAAFKGTAFRATNASQALARVKIDGLHARTPRQGVRARSESAKLRAGTPNAYALRRHARYHSLHRAFDFRMHRVAEPA